MPFKPFVENRMTHFRRITYSFVVLFWVVGVAVAQQDAIERRIDTLLQQMTLEEKAGQLSQYDGLSPQTIELAKKGLVGSFLNVLGAENTNKTQKLAVESRLRIPILFGFDVIHGYRTVFPVPIASASSFDPQLIEQSERVAAKEASAAGIRWAFAPMLDVAHDPRWGRMVEGAGEDPYLGGIVGAARVRGFQGQSLSDPQSVLACIKHYVGYGAVEGGREYNTVDMSEQTLREVYLPPFQAGLKAGSATVMAAFQDLNGVPASANRHTLTDILRGEWKFDGFVVSDYNSIRELTVHAIAHDEAEAAQLALTAGVDMSMADGIYGNHIPALVQSGKLPISVVDEAVRRVLRIKFKAGLFDSPYTDEKRAQTELLSAENLAVARKMAQESMVLLKNEKSLLPLDRGVKTIALIGPLVDDKANQMGSWVGNGRAQDAVTPLEGIKAKLANTKILVSRGVDLDLRGPHYDSGATGAAPAPSTATGAANANVATGPTSIADAVATAKKADVTILFLGEPSNYTGEASARSTLDLPGDQEKLLEAIVATGKPLVLVLESGRPLNITWANDRVPAILQAWYPGTQAGHAIADLLVGDVSPSARLPLSWPRTIGQIPVYYAHKNTGRPGSPDRWHTGYQFESKEPLFPFGYGLTYTTFKYSNVRVKYSNVQVETPNVISSGVLHVSADITNNGKREGTEVVQLYVRDRVAPTSRPVRELKGFSRVTLAPGATKTVEFTVNTSDLGSYDPSMKWVGPEGAFDIWVAPNSDEGIHGEFQVQ
jgi:beta-glucosidase